ncbi:MAG TPA: DsrE family protein [Stellaceae bacterium]|jgi:sulfur relay (sulfurtransferase) DsrF/TusC family protein|nr:DsrE family protein [Stellaceae bacterium]
MAKKTLNIVESAYRAVMEEQDDTILWLLAAMRGAGAEHTVVLRGNAVNYAVAGQGAPGLAIGGWKQTQAPRMDNDVIDLIKKHKIPVFVIEEDLAARGIERGELIPGVELLSSKMLPRHMAEYELVSHW